MAAAQGKARREAPPAQEPRARCKEAHKAQQSALSMAELGKGGPKERRVSFSVDTAGTPSGAASAEVSSGSVLPHLSCSANTGLIHHYPFCRQDAMR